MACNECRLAHNADAVVLVTEWPQDRDLDLECYPFDYEDAGTVRWTDVPLLPSNIVAETDLFDRERMIRARYRYIAL